MYTINFLANLVENHQILVYALIFLGIIIEGEFILLCTGVLVHLGALNFYFAGYQKINFKKYLKAELLSTVIWAPGLILLGYFFSYTAISVSHEIWRFLMIVLVLIIAFVLFDKLVSRIYEIFEEFYHNHS